MRRPLVALVVLLAVAAGSPTLGFSQKVDLPSEVSDSLVFVRVQRMYMGHTLITGGTGFFVHPNGYIMTDLHVVDDRFDAPAYMGGASIDAPPLAITISERTANGEVRQLPAELLASDERHSLALLKVMSTGETHVEIVHLAPEAGPGDIRMVGFPFAGYLEDGDSTNADDPRITVIPATTSKIIRGPNRFIVGFETAAKPDAGHCGSLVIGPDGTVLGITICKMIDSVRVAHGTGMAYLSGFFFSRVIDYKLDPGVVLKPPVPIAIELTSAIPISQLSGWTARVDLTVDGTKAGSIPLERGSDRWTGTLDVPSLKLDPSTLRITTHALLVDSDGEIRFVRRMDVDVVPGALSASP